MKRTVKIILGSIGVLIVICVAIIAIGYYLIHRSFTSVDGSKKIVQIKSKVSIYRDSYGVPHIVASNEYDAFFAAGYVHAQDRLWQLELQRRTGLGRLSEVVGKEALPIDKMFRTLGFRQIAEKLEGELDSSTRNALQAYADGINEYISKNKGHYPIEFDILQFEPEPWTVQHSLLTSRLMAWELNYSRWVDLLCATLVERVGAKKAAEAFPYWQPKAPNILPSRSLQKSFAEEIQPFLEGERCFQKLSGFSPAGGSNAWAVAGWKSSTQKPILANDPHLFLMIPSQWYELHLSSPTFEVAGMTLLGVPFVIAGRNRSIAWGITNGMLDDGDYYIEEPDTMPRPSRYRSANGWLPFRQREDTILVKDDPPVILTVYETERGPIINNIEPNAKYSNSLISFRWTGYEPTKEPQAFYALNKASNWKEFNEALSMFGVPAQNFVYADTAGNIGYVLGGLIPIRKVNGITFPFPGWDNSHAWQGFVPFDKNPKSLNPPEGFIITANNKIVGDEYPYYLSSHWEPPWRAQRLWRLLSSAQRCSPEAMERFQLDVYSMQAEEIVPYILHAFDSVEVSDSDVRTALEYFRNWNYDTRSEDVATTLFEVTHQHLLRNTFYDEMGDELFGLYDTLAATPLTAIEYLLEHPTSSWFDDVRTPVIEQRDDILRKSLFEAITELRSTLGGNLKEWQWGRLHTVTFRHAFGVHPILSKIFNLGPFPVGGTHATINVGYYFIGTPYGCTVGASMRQIMNLADVNDTRVILPPGQSGQLYHSHYDDQIQLWLNGIYRTRCMDIDEIESSAKSTLILEPY
ncbi:MAG TPA: penicillin acylase family protein [Bacteroidota bacterium]|nr:penicillin acylase family protein [Bacteroidota bacterium]